MTPDTSMIGIGDLAGLDLLALRQHWQEHYFCESPMRMSRELLIQAVAFRIQEREHGGLSRAARTKLVTGSAASGWPSGSSQSRARTRRSIKAGTRFLREWQGRTHEVIQTADGGFLYAGASYRSLSQIARQITGTRWSGPAFFGLTQNAGRTHVKA